MGSRDIFNKFNNRSEVRSRRGRVPIKERGKKFARQEQRGGERSEALCFDCFFL